MGARTRHRPPPDEAVRSVDAGMVFVTEHRNSNVMCLVAAGVGVSMGCFALEYFPSNARTRGFGGVSLGPLRADSG